MDRKQRRLHHQKPLVWAGETEYLALRSSRIRATSKRATLTMQAPWYATKRFGGRATYADEMTKVNGGEVNAMAKRFQKRLTEALKGAKRKKRIKRV
jgi:hypothetical protein